MNGQVDMFDDDEPEDKSEPEARARNTDPWTSHAAARSIGPDELRASQRAVYDCFLLNGPMHHQRLLEVYEDDRQIAGWPTQSESGLRTRTKELVRVGLVQDSGVTVLIGEGKRKRQSIVWEKA